MNRDRFLDLLGPITERLKSLDPSRPDEAQQTLNQEFPVDGKSVTSIARAFEEGLAQGWLCEREHEGVRYGRIQKSADDAGLSIDAVTMSGPGAGHAHPNGEFDLCIASKGEPTFDGNAPGWTVYAPDSWHVPTVEKGTMNILYFLPQGAIAFGPRE